MTSSDALFRLIHSLTQSEKRYFRIFAGRHVIGKKNDYLRLFDALNAQETLDEAQILQQFPDKAWQKHISAKKNYLYEMILRALRAFQASTDAKRKLRERLCDIESLLDKGLYEQAGKLLRKAKKLALKEEKASYYVELLALEKEWLMQTRAKGLEERLATVLLEEKATLGRQQTDLAYWEHFAAIYNLIRTKQLARSERDLQELATSMEAFRGLPDQDLSFESRLNSLNTRFYASFLKGEIPEAFALAKEMIALWDQFPNRIQEQSTRYIRLLNNFIVICHNLNEEEAFSQSLQRFLQIQSRSPHIQALTFFYYYNNLLIYLVNQQKIEEISLCISDLERQLPQKLNFLNNEFLATLYTSMSIAAYHAGDVRRSLAWVNRSLNLDQKDLREDIRSFSHIFFLLLHFELDNYDLLDYQVRSSKRYLKRRERLFQLENAILEFIRDLGKVTDRPSLLQRLHELHGELEQIRQIPAEKRVFSYFNFTDWVERQIAAISA